MAKSTGKGPTNRNTTRPNTPTANPTLNLRPQSGAGANRTTGSQQSGFQAAARPGQNPATASRSPLAGARPNIGQSQAGRTGQAGQTGHQSKDWEEE